MAVEITQKIKYSETYNHNESDTKNIRSKKHYNNNENNYNNNNEKILDKIIKTTIKKIFRPLK